MTQTPLGGAYRGLVCDLDGVVYQGADAVPHAVDVLRWASSRAGVVFATNNASRTPADVAGQLRGLGVPARADDVVTSSQAGAARCRELVGPGATVLAVGGPGVRAALESVGLVATAHAAPEVVAVLQGYGPEVTARDLGEASHAVRAGAIWVATNRDATLPTERGLVPGNGTLVDAVALATGAQPVVVGKPEAPLYDLAVVRLGVPSTEVVAVGDRLDTDIVGAAAAGLDSLWVLTGVDDLRSLVRAPQRPVPTFVGHDLRVLQSPYRTAVLDDGWWVCGDHRVRVDAASGAVDVVAPPRSDRGASEDDMQRRNALLEAAVRALLDERDQPGRDRRQVEAAAERLSSAVSGAPA